MQPCSICRSIHTKRAFKSAVSIPCCWHMCSRQRVGRREWAPAPTESPATATLAQHTRSRSHRWTRRPERAAARCMSTATAAPQQHRQCDVDAQPAAGSRNAIAPLVDQSGGRWTDGDIVVLLSSGSSGLLVRSGAVHSAIRHVMYKEGSSGCDFSGYWRHQ